MMRSSTLLDAFRGLQISATSAARTLATPVRPQLARSAVAAALRDVRPFSSTPAREGSWLEPSIDRTKKMMKGRPRVATGGSVKGTTVMWGDYGLRMKDHHRRISAKQLKNAEDTIKTRLRGTKYRLYKRVACNVGVYVSGNEIRMGKVVFEVKGLVHEAVVKDAFRLAGNKLPGQWEFVQKGEPPVVGITKLDGVTLEELKRPRKKIEPEQLLQQAQAAQTPSETAAAAPSAPAS
ncbi:54S ribosomal protein L16 like [Verticillium longisporum]|uniref:54S ribosomal protein L16 like n=1 Tax=Verticillium longisporum TaxID=100787 RepID=A0A8I2Z1F4_VERLO|nr:54S ribosomal protein L16 like [Verticillium longisporum]